MPNGVTTNYSFKKRLLGHPVRDDDIGENLDLIDTEIHNRETDITAITKRVTVWVGTNNFAGPGGVTITHNLDFFLNDTPITISPIENGSGAIGEIWMTDITKDSFKVCNSGNATTSFEWIIHRSFGLLGSIQFGLINSVEYGHEDLTKIDDAVSDFNEWGSDFVIELGDFIGHSEDYSNKSEALNGLDEVEDSYNNLIMDRKYVFGNHCLDWLLKSDYFSHTGMSEKYYSFDKGDFHFIVLDGMFKSNGDDWEECRQATGSNCPWVTTIYVSDIEKTWLESDLNATAKKTFVFMEAHFEGVLSIANASDVRTILENSGKVIATFSGNTGTNAKVSINGIDHYRMSAMDAGVPTAYAKIRVYADNSVRIQGIGSQSSY